MQVGSTPDVAMTESPERLRSSIRLLALWQQYCLSDNPGINDTRADTTWRALCFIVAVAITPITETAPADFTRRHAKFGCI